MFWIVLVVFSTVLIVTGLILVFPNFNQTRSTMQVTNIVHMAATYEGKQVFLGADTNLASPWLVTGFFVPPPYPAGHYEITLTNSASGESRVLRYTVTTEGSTPPFDAIQRSGASTARITIFTPAS